MTDDPLDAPAFPLTRAAIATLRRAARAYLAQRFLSLALRFDDESAVLVTVYQGIRDAERMMNEAPGTWAKQKGIL